MSLRVVPLLFGIFPIRHSLFGSIGLIAQSKVFPISKKPSRIACLFPNRFHRYVISAVGIQVILNPSNPFSYDLCVRVWRLVGAFVSAISVNCLH